MDLTLTPAQLELQARARAFVEDVLQPRRGRVRAGRRARAARLGGPASGGPPSRPGCTAGRSRRRSAARAGRRSSRSSSTSSSARSTGGLWSYIPGAYNVLIHCDAEQRTRYLDPSHARRAIGQLRDHRGRAPARTRGPSRRRPSATRRPATTSSTARSGSSPDPDDTDFMIFHCQRRRRRPARCRRSSSSTTTCPGVRDRSTTRTTCTRSPTGTRSSCSRTSASRPARSSAGSARPTS